MDMTSNKQTGFSAVICIIAIVVLVGIAGFISWQLYGHSSSKSAAAITNTTNANQPSQASISATTAAVVTAQGTYLDMKEYGIKVHLDNGIKDAIYSVHAASDGSRSINISTQTLTNESNGTCGPNGTPIAKVIAFTDSNHVADNVNIFKIGNKYFLIAGPQGTCSNDPTVQDLANQQYNTFQNDFKSLQADN